jgi:cytochrome c
MWNHFPQMYEKMKQLRIPFPHFTANEMAELIAYIYFTGYFDPPLTPADKLKGKTLFWEKDCISCHSLGGIGGKTGPDLTKWKRFASPVLWAQLMWNHSPAMSEKMKQKDIPRPRFEGNEMRDLIAYVYAANWPPAQDVIYALPGNPTRGKKLFREKKCMHCHSIFGDGGKIGSSLTAKRYTRTVTQLAGIMWNHSPIMSEKMEEEGIQRPQFSGAEMADIIAFLFFLGYFDQPGDPIKGKALFVSKKCVECHSIRGEGGVKGPDLTKYSSSEEPMQPVLVAQMMWNHAPFMAKAMEEKNIEWPRFSAQDMNDLMAFIKGSGKNN